MKRIICASCGKRYDYDQDETCPKCGAYTQPEWRPQSTKASTAGARPAQVPPAPSTAAVNRNTGKKTAQGKKVAWIFAVVAIIKIVLPMAGHLGDELKKAFSSDFSSIGAGIEEMAAQASFDEQAIQDEQPSSTEDSSTEDAVYSQCYSSEKFDFQPADGVHIIVNEYGTIEGGPFAEFLGEGYRCAYVDITFAVTDFEQAANADVTEPYIEVDGDYYNSFVFDELYDVSGCTPLDYTPLGEGAYAVTGQLYFTVPEHTETFQLCWDSSDGETESFEISFVPAVTTQNV